MYLVKKKKKKKIVCCDFDHWKNKKFEIGDLNTTQFKQYFFLYWLLENYRKQMVIVKWCWRLIILMNFSLTSILDLWDWVVKYFATFKCWPIWDYQTIKEIQNCLKFKFMCSDWHSAITCERKFQNDTRLTFWTSYSNMHHFPAYVKAGLKDLINNFSPCDTRSFVNSSLRAFSQEKLKNKIS